MALSPIVSIETIIAIAASGFCVLDEKRAIIDTM